MKFTRALLSMVAIATLSACSWMPEWMGGEPSGEGYVDTQPPYTSERTATNTPAPAPAPTVVEEPTAAPVNSAEPMIEKRVSK